MAQKMLPKTVKTRQREKQAGELRMAGATYQEIAQKLEYAGPSGAYKAVQRFLKRLGPDEDVLMLRKLAHARYERMLERVWGPATRKKKPSLKAQEAVRMILRDLRKMLGVDVPEELIHTMGGPITLNVIRAVPRPDDDRDDPGHDEDIHTEPEAS